LFVRYTFNWTDSLEYITIKSQPLSMCLGSVLLQGRVQMFLSHISEHLSHIRSCAAEHDSYLFGQVTSSTL